MEMDSQIVNRPTAVRQRGFSGLGEKGEEFKQNDKTQNPQTQTTVQR